MIQVMTIIVKLMGDSKQFSQLRKLLIHLYIPIGANNTCATSKAGQRACLGPCYLYTLIEGNSVNSGMLCQEITVLPTGGNKKCLLEFIEETQRHRGRRRRIGSGENGALSQPEQSS